MSYEQRDGQGSLFKNKRKETDRHPDYTGSMTVNGVEHWLSAWIKQGRGGTFMSLSLGKPKGEKPKRDDDPPHQQDPSDDIPF